MYAFNKISKTASRYCGRGAVFGGILSLFFDVGCIYENNPASPPDTTGTPLEIRSFIAQEGTANDKPTVWMEIKTRGGTNYRYHFDLTGGPELDSKVYERNRCDPRATITQDFFYGSSAVAKDTIAVEVLDVLLNSEGAVIDTLESARKETVVVRSPR